ncbi:MAG: hypothetical protein ACQESJ_09595 [Bacteroidota bacterium]
MYIVNKPIFNTMDNFDQLVKKMEEFKPFLDNMRFTYIAPRDKEQYYTFLASIYNSSATHSLYLRLSNPEVVRKILKDLGLLENVELEIYIATNDQHSTAWINKPLREYIKEQEINFQY